VITADVLVSQDPDADVFLDHIVVVAQSKPDYVPAVHIMCRPRAMRVPDFKLRIRKGTRLGWDSSRGSAAGHVYLHAVPAAELLPARDAELCRD